MRVGLFGYANTNQQNFKLLNLTYGAIVFLGLGYGTKKKANTKYSRLRQSQNHVRTLSLQTQLQF